MLAVLSGGGGVAQAVRARTDSAIANRIIAANLPERRGKVKRRMGHLAICWHIPKAGVALRGFAL